MSKESWVFFVFMMVLLVGALSVIAYSIWSSHDIEMAKITYNCGLKS